MIRPFLYWCGRLVTSVLLHPAIRDIPFVRQVYTSLYLFGKNLSEHSERAILRRQVRKGMIIVDIGANVGFYTKFLAKIVGPSGHIFAFEPDPLSRSILEKRTAKLKQVSISPLALSDTQNEGILVCNPENRANNALESPSGTPISGERFPVQTTTFDAWWAEIGKPHIQFIKMDVEGWEKKVVKGMERFLREKPPDCMVLEFNPPLLRQAGEDPRTIFSSLQEKGFALFAMNKHHHLLPILDATSFCSTYETSLTNLWAFRKGSTISTAKGYVTLQANEQQWQSRPLLRKAYKHLFALMKHQLPPSNLGPVVEIGSGLGKIKDVIPLCITSDIFMNPKIDRLENVYHLTFPDNSVGAFLMLDVFHHLDYPGNFLAECHRALAPGGRLIILDPAISLLGFIVFGPGHSEKIGWREDIRWFAAPGIDPSSSEDYAAMGNASRIFWKRMNSEVCKEWRTVSCSPLTLISSILSGGFQGPVLVPAWSYRFLRILDKILQPFPRIFATRLLIVLEK